MPCVELQDVVWSYSDTFFDRGMARVRNCEPERVAYGPGVDLFPRVFVQSSHPTVMDPP